MNARLMGSVVVAAVCAGCGIVPLFVSGDGTSGIAGTVTEGPTCPVQTVPPTPGCEDRPKAATIIVRSAVTDIELTRFTSAVDGTFRVALAAGTYVLDPQPASPRPPSAPRQSVEVQAGAFTQVMIQYDTGIR